ncbi:MULTISPECIES: sialidase family protein [unclassified Bradyrhizobium]|uniref:sialidase family protein n=1 Tax=unclassified Bradyrhizobium TaxID=2631580 RepID=UPI0028E1BA7F|nr:MULTISPECIES: sialidase family protein [unclassified Bradyrhizobium]
MTRTSRLRSALAGLAIGLLCPLAAQAQMAHQHGSDAACEGTELRCATKVTPFFAANGKLWLAWMAGGRVSVASSTDAGQTYSAAVPVNEQALNLDWGPDARPKLVVDGKGIIAVAFSIFRDQAFNGQVLYTRSEDGGKSFAEMRPITSSNESQRFEALALDQDGMIFVAWIDKRNRAPAKAAGRSYDGAALFFSSSRDGGATYVEATLAQDNTCECCRLGLAFAGPGRPVVMFRNIFDGGVRDHAVVTFSDLGPPGEVARVSTDDWQIKACPHQGPSLAVSPTGAYHVAWFTNGKIRKGLFYAHSRDGGRTFSEPMAIGQADRNPTRPYVLATPDATTLVWKEFDGERTTVLMMQSRDDGETWSKPRAVASTNDASDHPLLVARGKQILLSWMTKADGYRLQAIGDES